ncbi:MAG: type II secretion system protein GspM [Myxococcota bacterium]
MRQRIQQLLEKLTAAFEELDQRQRRLAVLALIAVLGMIGMLGVYQVTSSVEAQRAQADTYRKEIRQVRRLAATYRQSQSRRRTQQQQLRRANVSLFSFLPTVAKSLGLNLSDLDEHTVPLPDHKLVQRSVSVTLKQLSVDKLTSFLQAVEESGPSRLIKVTRLQVMRRGDQDLDAQITIAIWQRS